MEWNMDTIRAQVEELNKMDAQTAYIEMPEETREFYDAVMEEAYNAVMDAGYTLEPSTQMGRGTVDIYNGDYDKLLVTVDFQTETRSFLDLVDAGLSFDEVVKQIADGYLELAHENDESPETYEEFRERIMSLEDEEE